FVVGGPVGDSELLLCHGMVCVVGRMRDLILQLSKSSIYSTKPIGGKEASEIATNGCVPANQFTWHPVSRAVGNVKNQGAELIQPV
ncbi:hypothetical protein ABLC89_25070, partial [Escherichia coli]